MFEIIGKYNTAIVYATSVDAESYAQVLRMCNSPDTVNLPFIELSGEKGLDPVNEAVALHNQS